MSPIDAKTGPTVTHESGSDLRFYFVVLASVKTNTRSTLSLPSGRANPVVAPNRRVRRAVHDEIVHLYGQGMSTRQVAAKTGVSKTKVLGVLKHRGVQMRVAHRH